jgi:hypothetical protein
MLSAMASFLASLRFSALQQVTNKPPISGEAFTADFLDGMRAITKHRGIIAVLILMLFGDSLAAAVRQMAPAFSARALGAGIEGVSTLLACAGIGAMLSALWLAHRGDRRFSPIFIIWDSWGF